MLNYKNTEDANARKKLEEMEKEFESGRVNALPPKEFEDFVAQYEELHKRLRSVDSFCVMV